MNVNHFIAFCLFLITIILGWAGLAFHADLVAMRKDIIGEGMSIEATVNEVSHDLKEVNRKVDVILAPAPAIRPPTPPKE